MLNAEKLLEKYLRNECTDQEKEFLDYWFHHYKDEKIDDQLINKDYERTKAIFYNNLKSKSTPVGSLFKSLQKVAAVLILVTLLFAITYFIFNKTSQSSLDSEITYNNIKNTTLIINNKSQYFLDGDINENIYNVLITGEDSTYSFLNTNNENTINTVITPNRKKVKLQLPDGSIVWLGAQSKLTFTSHLTNETTRNVKLEGKAYFEVVKNPTKPFIVLTANQEIKVLGTHFCIEENNLGTSTSLLEGSVLVIPSKKKSSNAKPIKLKAGEQSILNNENIKITNFDSEKVLDWKSGYFTFKQDSFRYVIQIISKWYDVTFDVQNQNNISNQTLTAHISRDKSIDEIISIIQKSCQVRIIKKSEQKYTIQ